MHQVLKDIEANFLELPKLKMFRYKYTSVRGNIEVVEEFTPPTTLREFFVKFTNYIIFYGSAKTEVDLQNYKNLSIYTEGIEFTASSKYRSLMDIFRLANNYYNCGFEEFLLTVAENDPITYRCHEIDKCMLGKKNNLYLNYKANYKNDPTPELLNNNFLDLLTYLKDSANETQLTTINKLIREF